MTAADYEKSWALTEERIDRYIANGRQPSARTHVSIPSLQDLLHDIAVAAKAAATRPASPIRRVSLPSPEYPADSSDEVQSPPKQSRKKSQLAKIQQQGIEEMAQYALPIKRNKRELVMPRIIYPPSPEPMSSERALELLDALPVSGGPVEEAPPERPKRKKKKHHIEESAIASAQKQSGEEAPSGAATSHPSQIGSIPDPANPECQEGVGESASIGLVVYLFLFFVFSCFVVALC